MDAKADEQQKEDILDLIQGTGLWQRRIFAMVFLCAIPLATHNLCMTFFAPNIEHWCARPPDINITTQEWKHIAKQRDFYCNRHKLDNISEDLLFDDEFRPETDVFPCESWEYDESLFGPNVLSKFDLVCDRAWFVSLSKSIFIGGYIVAVTLIGYISDKYGRRPVILVCNFIAAVTTIISAFSTSFLMFGICRFFIAMGVAGAFSTCFVLMMEVMGKESRSIYGMAINFGWSLGFLILPAIVWLIRDWTSVELILSTPSFIFMAFSWFGLPESPRWLIGKGHGMEAHDLLMKAAKINESEEKEISAKLKKLIAEVSEEQVSENKEANVIQLLTTAGLWQKTLIVFYLWFVNAFVYYGISYNTNELAGNPYINFTLSMAVEMPAYAISLVVIYKVGRKYPQAASMILGGIAGLLMYFVQEDVLASSLVSMSGKFFISCSFAIIYLYTAEIFPTVIRNASFGSSSFCGRLGSIIAPFVRELGNATHPVIPQLIFGVLALTAGCLVFFLPETHKLNVPDTIKEAVDISKSASCKKKTIVLKDIKYNSNS